MIKMIWRDLRKWWVWNVWNALCERTLQRKRFWQESKKNLVTLPEKCRSLQKQKIKATSLTNICSSYNLQLHWQWSRRYCHQYALAMIIEAESNSDDKVWHIETIRIHVTLYHDCASLDHGALTSSQNVFSNLSFSIWRLDCESAIANVTNEQLH